MSASSDARPASKAARPALAGLLASGLVGAAVEDGPSAVAAAHAPRAVVAVGQFVTGFGTSGYMFAFSGLTACIAVLAMGRGQSTWSGAPPRLAAERAIYFFATIASSGIVAQVIKHVVGRARPVLLPVDGPFGFHPLSMANDLASFPSGHATSAFAAAVALGLMRPSWRWWFLGCACLIGASRVLVGAHYPSDVVAGAGLGGAVALAMARVFARRGLAFAPLDGLKPEPPRSTSTVAGRA